MSAAVESAGRVLDVLDLLLRADFAYGIAPGDIVRELKLSPSAVTRYVATLEGRDMLERIPETGRLRPALRLVTRLAAIVASLDAAERRMRELATRINTL